ncbi:hypothetical protein [Streptomyces synnematoformans]|uniref:hypothetical protein n=1 Tax=Streptomyces synnematoformans TaxID=415721 RepID=UPI0031E38770
MAAGFGAVVLGVATGMLAGYYGGIVDILPNVLAPVLGYASLLVPVAIIFSASLSLLGLGVPTRRGELPRNRPSTTTRSRRGCSRSPAARCC